MWQCKLRIGHNYIVITYIAKVSRRAPHICVIISKTCTPVFICQIHWYSQTIRGKEQLQKEMREVPKLPNCYLFNRRRVAVISGF